MCISAWPAVFTKTITGTWETIVDNKLHHVIWYQNNVGDGGGLSLDVTQYFEDYVNRLIETGKDSTDYAFTLSSKGVDPNLAKQEAKHRSQGNSPRKLYSLLGMKPTGNCLIIPLQGRWDSIRLLNTADTPNLLKNIQRDLKMPEMFTLGFSSGSTFGGTGEDRFVFLQFDVYDIVIAENPATIPKVIDQINPEKRPAVNESVFQVMQEWYACPVAVCCFNSMDQAEAKPIGFAFQPSNPESISVYTLDGHDGKSPQAERVASMDHTIFVGSHLTPPQYTADITYDDSIPNHLAPYLLHNLMGLDLVGPLINGDIIFDTELVRQGYFEGQRQLPRFAPNKHAEPPTIVRSHPYKNGKQSPHSQA